MQKPLIRILYWLGIMAVLTALSMGLWFLVCGGSQTTTSLKWLQFMQTTGTFLLPPILCAWLWDTGHKPFVWLQMDKGVSGKVVWWAVALMVCALPGINLLADLNSRVVLPESLGFIEEIFKRQEEAAAALTERFLQADSVGAVLINIGLMALLPALSEELSFRGTLQQVLGNSHAAIWVTAFVFSAIHMQFYGFVPRMLLGAVFGYMFVWTKNLWVPMLMHFTNNGIAVLVYSIWGQNNSADTIGAGTTWWLGVISILITCPGLLIFYRRTRTQ